MNLIERYIFKIAHQAFWGCLIALTAVIWITSALRQLDLLTSKGQTILVFLSMTFLSLPGLISFIAPFTLLIAVLYTLNRLNSDSELIVLSAAGFKPAKLFKPFLILGLLVSLIVWAISLYIMPSSLYTMRSLTNKIRADFISFFVQEGQFANLEGLTFHYQEKTGNTLNRLLIQDRRDPEKIATYLAEKGYTKDVEERSFLILENGSVQTQAPEKTDTAIIGFSQYSIDLSTFQEQIDAGNKPSERSTIALLNPAPNDILYKLYPGRFIAELHERISTGLFPIAMVFIAFAAMGSAYTTRTGRSTSITAAVFCAALLRFVGYAAKNAIISSPHSWFLAYIAPFSAIFLSWFIIFCDDTKQKLRYFLVRRFTLSGKRGATSS